MSVRKTEYLQADSNVLCMQVIGWPVEDSDSNLIYMTDTQF